MTQTAPAETPVATPIPPVVEAAPPELPAPAQPAPVEPEKPAEPPPDAARFAALAKKAREVREGEAALKTEKEQLAAQKAEFEAWKSKRDNAKLNPKAWLEEAGLTLEQINTFYLNDEKPTADTQVDIVKAEIEKLKAEQAAEKAKEVEERVALQRKQEEQVIERFKSDTVSYVKDNAEKYELIAAYGEEQAVADVIMQHHAETNRLMSTEEAADLVEKHLLERAEKALQTAKIKAKVTPPAPAPAEPPKAEVKPPEPPKLRAPTLSNQLAPKPAISAAAAKSAKEREQRALAVLGTSKK